MLGELTPQLAVGPCLVAGNARRTDQASAQPPTGEGRAVAGMSHFCSYITENNLGQRQRGRGWVGLHQAVRFPPA
jgi:hypothetical protein